jgi:hypothetical protein
MARYSDVGVEWIEELRFKFQSRWGERAYFHAKNHMTCDRAAEWLGLLEIKFFCYFFPILGFLETPITVGL